MKVVLVSLRNTTHLQQWNTILNSSQTEQLRKDLIILHPNPSGKGLDRSKPKRKRQKVGHVHLVVSHTKRRMTRRSMTNGSNVIFVLNGTMNLVLKSLACWITNTSLAASAVELDCTFIIWNKLNRPCVVLIIFSFN